MIKEIKIEKILYEKRIDIIFRFPSSKGISKVAKYGPERFNEQLDLFIKLQSGKLSKEDRYKTLKECGVDFDPEHPERIIYDAWGANKDLGIKNSILRLPKPTYSQYISETTRLFSEYILKLMADYAKLSCLDDNFKIIIYIFDDLKEEWYGSQQSKEFHEFRSYSKKNMVVFAIGGMYWLYKLFLPFHYTKRFDAMPLVKLFTHEFSHYTDTMNKTFTKEAKYKEIFGDDSKLKNKNFISDIFSPLYWEMLEDGRAEFCERPYQQRIAFNGLSSLKSFKKLITEIAQMTDFEKAMEIYGKQIDSATVKYYWARMMSYTVALYVASTSGLQKEFTFYIADSGSAQNHEETNLKLNFKKYWSRNNSFYMKNLDKSVNDKAKELLFGITTYWDFVMLYEKACAHFGIPETQKILSMKFIRNIHSINEKAIKFENDVFIKQIEKSIS